MATDKKLSALTLVSTTQIDDLLYLVTFDTDGTSTSKAIKAQDLLKYTVSGTNRIISGQVVWSGVGYTWESVDLTYEIGGILYYSDGAEITNAAPDATNPRFDKIFVDADGLGIKVGTPAVSPTEPNLDNPESELETNLVLVQNGTTVPPELSLGYVYSENAQEVGGEWDSTSSGTTFSLANTLAPINLTKDIKTINSSADGDYFEFNHSTLEIEKAAFNNLRFKVKSLGNWKNDYVTVKLYNDAEFIGQAIVTKSTFNTSDTTIIQTVIIPSEDFFYSDWATATSFNKIRFLVRDGGNGGILVQAQFDLIEIDSGGTSSKPVPITSIPDADSIGLNEEKDELKGRVDMGTGTAINWSSGISFIHDALTTNITITDINLPSGTDTKTITIDVDFDTYSITFPTYYTSKGGDVSTTGKTRIVIDCINGNSGSEEVYYTLIPNA